MNNLNPFITRCEVAGLLRNFQSSFLFLLKPFYFKVKNLLLNLVSYLLLSRYVSLYTVCRSSSTTAELGPFKWQLLILVVSISTTFAQKKVENDSGFIPIEGPYLGQKTPSLKPEVFAPGIVTTEHFEAFGTFTPDLKEFYFVRRGGKYQKPTLVVFRSKNKQWNEAVISPFIGEPSISPDGQVFHLGNKYMERTSSGWSEVKSLGTPFKNIPIMRLSSSSKGTYVFDEREEIGTIRYSRLINGQREKPRTFGKEINTGKWIAHPFIAPDESYLIWDCEREGGYGDSDLYISFRQKDGSWGSAINMGGNINNEYENIYGSVTPDGKYFFFHTYFDNGEVNIFWIDAMIIENLRNKQ